MLATPTPLKAAPALRAWRPGLRLHVKPSAFGNGIGNSLVSSLSAADVKSQQQKQLQQARAETARQALLVQQQQDYEEYLKDQAGRSILAPRPEDQPSGTGLRPGGGVGLKWGNYRAGQAPDNNDNSASTTPAMTADERMRLEKSQGYDRGRYVRVQKGDALTRLTADQVEFGATIAYNRLRNPNHIEVGQDIFIPERGTYNEDAAKQVANAYWKAEEARQQLQVKAQEASTGKTIGACLKDETPLS